MSAEEREREKEVRCIHGFLFNKVPAGDHHRPRKNWQGHHHRIFAPLATTVVCQVPGDVEPLYLLSDVRKNSALMTNVAPE